MCTLFCFYCILLKPENTPDSVPFIPLWGSHHDEARVYLPLLHPLEYVCLLVASKSSEVSPFTTVLAVAVAVTHRAGCCILLCFTMCFPHNEDLSACRHTFVKESNESTRRRTAGRRLIVRRPYIQLFFQEFYSGTGIHTFRMA